MMSQWKHAAAALMLLVVPCAVGQSRLSSCATQKESTPCIDKIEPPDWWADMPNPMLLLHGDHLTGAEVSASGKNIAVEKVRVSANGHWAFLWLDTSKASPQNIVIKAKSSAGSTSKVFQLQQRRHGGDSFRGFSSSDVMYLIMTDRFANGDISNDAIGGDDGGRSQSRGWHGGDFKGLRQHLDYLQQLGITTIWTTPITSNAGMHDSYHGYGSTDLYAVDPHFGTVDDYQRLATDIHARGMKIVMDMVPNHVGAAIPWLNDPPAPDWFHGTPAQHLHLDSSFNFLTDPHATPQQQINIIDGWFTDSLPDMNQENPLVAKYFIQNAIWWIETAGLDGLRLDTFPYVGRQFWSEYHRQIHALYPHLTTVGEIFNAVPTVTAYFAGDATRAGIDTGLDTPFDFPTYFALKDVLLRDKPMTEIAEVLRQDWLYPHPERLVTFFDNHDTKRFLSEPGASVEKLKVAIGLLATLRGMPQLYSGDEIAMRGGEDPDNRHDFPGGFPGEADNAFFASSRTQEQQNIFSWTQTLLKLRAQEMPLKQGDQQTLFADETAFAFVRGEELRKGCSPGKDERLLIVVGKNTAPQHLQLKTMQTALEACEQFAQIFLSQPIKLHAINSLIELDLPSYGFAIYRVN